MHKQNHLVQYTLLPPELSTPERLEPIASLCRLVGDGRELPEKYALPLRAVEHWLVNLPAAQSYYSEEGGALTYALVTATNAARIASSSIFAPTAANEERSLLQPQYEYAAFLSGLSCVLAFPSREVRVVSGSKSPWNCLLEPLRSYISLGDTYSVTWLQRASRVPSASHGAWVGAMALLPFAQKYISAHDVARDFVSAIMPDAQPTAGEALLVQIVRRACLKSVADYKSASAVATVLPACSAQQLSQSVTAGQTELASLVNALATHTNSTFQAPKTAALSQLQSVIASARMTGQIAPYPVPHKIIAANLDAPLSEEQIVINHLMANFAPWAREFFQSLRDDVQARDPVIQKMRIDHGGKGFVLQRQMITRRGLDDNKVSDYLQHHGLLVEKTSTSLIVDHRMGAFITHEGEHAVGAHEKPAAAR